MRRTLAPGTTKRPLRRAKHSSEDGELRTQQSGPVEEAVQTAHQQPGSVRVEIADIDQGALQVRVEGAELTHSGTGLALEVPVR